MRVNRPPLAGNTIKGESHLPNMNPQGYLVTTLLIAFVILFVLYLILTPCGSSSCGCGSASSGASGASQALEAKDAVSGDASTEDLPADVVDVESDVEDEEPRSGVSFAHGDGEDSAASALTMVGGGAMTNDASARSRLSRAQRHLSAATSSVASASGTEVASGASLAAGFSMPSVDDILALQQAADNGDVQAEQALSRAMGTAAAAAGEVPSGASAEPRGPLQRVTVPMTADDAQRLAAAGDLKKRLGADFWISEDDARKRRERARRMEALAAENPDRATDIMRIAGAGMMQKPTNAGMQEAKRRRRERSTAFMDEGNEVETGNSAVKRGKDARRMPPASHFDGREVPADYQRMTAVVRADNPSRAQLA